jgi:hypothetical protein
MLRLAHESRAQRVPRGSQCAAPTLWTPPRRVQDGGLGAHPAADVRQPDAAYFDELCAMPP